MGKFEDQMCQSAAKRLVASLSTLHSGHFKKNSLSDELIDAISKLNLTDQIFLVERSHYFINIELDQQALERQLQELRDSSYERELEDTYLLNGAPHVLMRRLFGMHASEFSRRRNSLRIKGSGNGRPSICDEDTERKIWFSWNSKSELPERDRFLKVAEETGFDLHLVWSELRQHIDS